MMTVLCSDAPDTELVSVLLDVVPLQEWPT